MKKISILLFVFTANASFAQITNHKASDVPVKQDDTSLRVEIVDHNNPVQNVAVFIDGSAVFNQSLLKSLAPNQIEEINVVKRDTVIKNLKYNGQIYLKMKPGYSPKIISLSDLKKKYTGFKEMPVVFTLDGNFVNANYDNYLVDENNLLTIIVDRLHSENEKSEIGLIKLLTKTEANIKNRNQIILKGREVKMKQ